MRHRESYLDNPRNFEGEATTRPPASTTSPKVAHSEKPPRGSGGRAGRPPGSSRRGTSAVKDGHRPDHVRSRRRPAQLGSFSAGEGTRDGTLAEESLHCGSYASVR